MIPSGKLIALIIFSLCIVAGSFYYAEHKNDPKNIYKSENTTLVKNTVDPDKDTDGDGILDWEEVLWGTDPNVKDADKIKKNFQTKTNQKTEKLTATESLARSLFSQYMNLKQVGLQNDKDSQDSAASQSIANSLTPEPKLYDTTSIRIDSSTDLYTYGNNIGLIFQTNNSTKNEALILKEALTTNDPEKLKEIEPIIKNYSNIKESLLKTKVPEKAISIHVDLINSINKLIFIDRLFTKAFVDPVAAVQGTASYQNGFENLRKSFESLRNLLRDSQINFHPNDPGYFFQPK